MRPRNVRILVALAAGGMLFGPGRAGAWVAVRVAPRAVGAVAVGVAAGAVAGAAVASTSQPTTVVTAPPPPAPAGAVVTTLPSGCVQSGGRYQCGSVVYQPYFGGNGVYYEVVR
jgi:hypothetical protein